MRSPISSSHPSSSTKNSSSSHLKPEAVEEAFLTPPTSQTTADKGKGKEVDKDLHELRRDPALTSPVSLPGRLGRSRSPDDLSLVRTNSSIAQPHSSSPLEGKSSNLIASTEDLNKKALSSPSGSSTGRITFGHHHQRSDQISSSSSPTKRSREDNNTRQQELTTEESSTKKLKTETKEPESKFHTLSEPRPPTMTVAQYTMQQHGFVGNKGHPTPKTQKKKDDVTGQWEKTGAKIPAKDPLWTTRNQIEDLPPSNSNADFSSGKLPHWEQKLLTKHIDKHQKEPWFKEFFGEGVEGIAKYERESVHFARISPNSDLVRRYALTCVAHPNSPEHPSAGRDDVLLYSYKNNMLLMIHRETATIHTFISPRNAEKEVRDNLDSRS